MVVDKKWIGAAVVVASIGAACAAEPETASGEDDIVAGKRLTVAEVAQHVRAAGFAEKMVGKMVCVAKYESSYYTRAQNGIYRGLFQIGTPHVGRKGCPSNAEGLYDPAQNARCARAVYDGQGIGAWTAYAAHRSECDKFAVPAAPATTKDAGAKDAAAPAKDAGSKDAGSDTGTTVTETEPDTEAETQADQRPSAEDTEPDADEDKDSDEEEAAPSAKRPAAAESCAASPGARTGARGPFVLLAAALVLLARRRRRAGSSSSATVNEP